jgi:hypothetical protein
MSETQIKHDILEMIARRYPAIQVTRHQSGIILAAHGRRIHCGPAGWPDIIGYLPDGRFLGIEVKAPNARPQDHEERQRERGRSIIEAGGVYLLVTSVEAAQAGIEEALHESHRG